MKANMEAIWNHYGVRSKETAIFLTTDIHGIIICFINMFRTVKWNKIDLPLLVLRKPYWMEENMNTMNTQTKIKKIEDSQTENSYLLMPRHINGYGRLFGGMLMQWIDEIAGIVAKRHAQTEVTTAAIDNLQFKSAAYLNQTVVLIGKITYVGKTSMEVRVDTYVEELDGTRKVINRAYVVMVAIDQEGNPVRIPGLALETEAARAEWEGGEKRYQLRKTRRQEGY